MSSDAELVITILLSLFYLALTAITIASNSKRLVNKRFAIFLVSAFLWISTLYLFYKSTDIVVLNIFGRINFASGTLMAGTLLLFTSAYPNNRDELRQYQVKAIIVSTAAIILLCLFSNLISQEEIFIESGIETIFGPLYFIYALHVLTGMLGGVYILIRKYITSKDKIIRVLIRNLFISLLAAIVWGLTTNVILPSLFQRFDFQQAGPIGTIFFSVTVAYSIIRHRFLDIRVLIGRIVYYSLLATLPIGTFFFLVTVYTQLFGTVFHPTVYFISIFVGIGFVILFNKANEVLRTQVDSRLINPGYNPLETAELLSSDLSLMIDLPKINERVMQTLTKTIRPDYSAIVLFANEQHPDARVYASDGKDIDTQVKGLTQATKTLWENMGKHPIVQDEIDIEIEEGIYRNTRNIAAAVKESMLQIGGKVILTLGNKDNLVGMIIIGQKEADSPYTTTDIDFLKSVANTAGLAVERSLLYEEVQQFANTLQEKVDKATVELKKTNGDLEKALAELQEARRVERDMIDVMGHELRTPISIVRNALVMLEHQQEKTEAVPKTELEKYLAMALESTRREITLIETLLSATKVDAARMQLYFEKVDFKDVVNDGIEGQKTPAEKKGVTLTHLLPDEEISVYADRTRIQEVMDNLVSNAVKYTLRGEVKVHIWKDDKFGWISITDSGIGIAEQDLENLGKKFFRAKQYVPDNGVGEETKVVRPGGTGLGLYVTFDLVGIMGGQLYINSKVGEGSTFTFGIPLYADQKPKQVDQTFDPQTRVQKPHIFIGQKAPTPTKGE